MKKKEKFENKKRKLKKWLKDASLTARSGSFPITNLWQEIGILEFVFVFVLSIIVVYIQREKNLSFY